MVWRLIGSILLLVILSEQGRRRHSSLKALLFTSRPILSPDSDTNQATTDEQTELKNLKIDTNSTRTQFVGYWRSGFGPSKEHGVTISNLANTALNVDAFMYVKALYYCF